MTIAEPTTQPKVAPATEPLLQLEGVVKDYGPNRVLDDVSFTIHAGEVVGLLGDNGAGKSTLVKIMSGVVPMTQGRYFWQDEELGRVTRPETERRGVETIFQDSALVPTMSITRNIFAGREVTNALGFMRLKEMDRITTGSSTAWCPSRGSRVPSSWSARCPAARPRPWPSPVRSTSSAAC